MNPFLIGALIYVLCGCLAVFGLYFYVGIKGYEESSWQYRFYLDLEAKAIFFMAWWCFLIAGLMTGAAWLVMKLLDLVGRHIRKLGKSMRKR